MTALYYLMGTTQQTRQPYYRYTYIHTYRADARVKEMLTIVSCTQSYIVYYILYEQSHQFSYTINTQVDKFKAR